MVTFAWLLCHVLLLPALLASAPLLAARCLRPVLGRSVGWATVALLGSPPLGAGTSGLALVVAARGLLAGQAGGSGCVTGAGLFLLAGIGCTIAALLACARQLAAARQLERQRLLRQQR